MLKKVCVMCVAAMCLLAVSASAADLTSSLSSGTVQLKSAGPLAFGPEGILFVGDPQQAAVFAIATGDTSGDPDQVSLNVKGINTKVAAALGSKPADVKINDLAVNPLSGNAYLSISRGRGPEAMALILKVDSSGEISELSLRHAKFAKAKLPNPGDDDPSRGRRNPRPQSITDLGYLDGRLLVAGLSNEEFASTLRSIPFPFKSVDKGTAVEIFHGAHGRFETRSPVRTFATYSINDKPHLLAAYTCTPLVKFSLDQLKPGAKIMGTTVAELGNGNRPLDMIVYSQDGRDFVLMANNSRGMMKISTEGLATRASIVDKVADKAGQSYDTITKMKGVVQLDRLNSGHALVIVENDGVANLETVALP